MLKDRKLFFVSLFFFLSFIIFNFPFPHATPFGELIFSASSWPINNNSSAIIALLLLGLCLILLVKSLNKFKGRAVIIAILAAALLPPFIAKTYQHTLASGIYAVHYDSQASSCQFDKINDEIISIQCDLAFENYSSNDVQFTVEFNDRYRMEDDPVQELLNAVGPFKVTLSSNESGIIQFNREIDVSDLNNQLEAGGGNGMMITLHSDGNIRKL